MAWSKLLLETPSIPYSGNLSLHSSISYINIIKYELDLNHELNLNSLPYTGIYHGDRVSYKISHGSGTLILVRCISDILESEPFCIYWIHLDHPIWSENTDITNNNWCNPVIRSTLIIKSKPFCIYWIHLDHPIWSGKNTDNNWCNPLIMSTLIMKSKPFSIYWNHFDHPYW